MKTRIVVNFSFPAVHCFPDNPDPTTYFLNKPHRHVFHVEIKKEMSGGDREIEFIAFKREVMAYVNTNWSDRDLGSASCEFIAEKLLTLFHCQYVKVMEDGENGAEVCDDGIYT